MNQNHRIGYDIIGDIHGHADELEVLLNMMGYMEKDGVFGHEEGRRVIFLGDYVDRGPQIRRVLEIVRAMVEGGAALAILGNHEVNALRYHAKDAAGVPLRPHGSKNRSQHKATIDQIAKPAPDEWREWLDWFAGLPLWIDLGGLRVVHAAWDEAAMKDLDDIGPLVGATLERFSRKGTEEYDAISRLINGPEAKLLAGREVLVNGDRRKEVRVRWWNGDEYNNARDAIYPSDPGVAPLPIVRPPKCSYDTDAPPVFFGHYATSIEESVVAANVACLDLGIGKGGCLAAFRWDGERTIDPSKLVTTW